LTVNEYQVPEPLFQFLSSTGKGASTGGTNAVGNYSTATGSSGETFILQPPSSEDWRIERMLVHIRDTGVFAAGEYGSTSALTNGVVVRVETDTGTVYDLTDVSVKTNAQWGRQCYDARVDTWGVGDEFLNARWTFSKAGYPIRLDGTQGQRLAVYLQDDLSNLTDHTFYAQGFKEDAVFKTRSLGNI